MYMATDDWIQSLDLGALEHLKDKPRIRIRTTDSVGGVPPIKAGRQKAKVSGPKLKELVRAELHLLICTKNKKYTKLRDELATYGKGAEVFVLTSITAFITVKLGALWVQVWSLVASALIVILKISKEVWCKKMAPVA
jgi:hypothetical protein